MSLWPKASLQRGEDTAQMGHAAFENRLGWAGFFGDHENCFPLPLRGPLLPAAAGQGQKAKKSYTQWLKQHICSLRATEVKSPRWILQVEIHSSVPRREPLPVFSLPLTHWLLGTLLLKPAGESVPHCASAFFKKYLFIYWLIYFVCVCPRASMCFGVRSYACGSVYACVFLHVCTHVYACTNVYTQK